MEDELRELVSDEDEQEYLMEPGKWRCVYRSNVDELIQPVLQSEADAYMMELGFPTQFDEETVQDELTDHFDKSTTGQCKFLELIRRGIWLQFGNKLRH